ncbi:YedE family putative selenium transporter [Ferrimonas balearica]|uniref:YedE family putative selenium transporter n=1 Tax=Ferrimonas balearica TaxID=44012 RepID=UPI001C9665CD|nr:YedE family putative selenium transporter [Ferrimonas balearica]MBY5979425.1 YedE-related selenium metabolism membrane protein [Ferrimonas balearica]
MKVRVSHTASIILCGGAIGLIAALLQYYGNPPNMGFCAACFERDIAGALGLHRANVVQYLRPEIIGLVFGAMVAALRHREFKPRGGAAPLLRFILGMFAMFGALVFLGCPWRTLLRLAGGDLNALFGLAGLLSGVALGVALLKRGVSLGQSSPAPMPIGWLFPGLMTVLALLLLIDPASSPNAPFASVKGPGAMHAPIWMSLAAGLTVGYLLQRSRFCTTGAFRDLLMARDPKLLSGVIALLATTLVVNLLLGQFHLGFDGQPIAHNDGLWNYFGMVLAGACFILAGGCAGRQLVLTGEGDTDAGVFVLGMLSGGALAHNFALASSPAGVTPSAPYVVIGGLVFVLAVGVSLRKRLVVG